MENLAIVILNWNGKSFLEQFLPAVITHSAGARIIVADNASGDGSVQYLKDHFPEIEILVNQSNGGFAKGYNDALKQVNAEFYLLLNSDVEVSENWLEPLLSCIQDKQVAACQPKIIAFHDRKKFEHAGACGGFIDKNYYPFCRGRLIGDVETDSGQYNGELEVFWTSGACMLIRSELFHQVNGFDEDFFAHMEEIDLCWRLKRLGFSFRVVPQALVYHVGGGTLPYLSPNKTYLNFRNSLYMITKNHEGMLFFKLFYRMSLDGVAAMMFLFKGDVAHFKAVFRAHGSFYKNLNKMLDKRKAFQPEKSRFNKKGFYRGSLLWAYFFKKIRHFSDLNMRLFD